MDDLELELKSLIDHMLSIGPLHWNDMIWCEDYRFISTIMNNTDASFERKVGFYYSDNMFHTLIWERDNPDSPWGIVCRTDKNPGPRTEEEYFQYSTLYELEFSLEFYQYILGVLSYE